VTRKTGWITRISIEGEKVMKPKERTTEIACFERGRNGVSKRVLFETGNIQPQG
jgi:hypothetical protein